MSGRLTEGFRDIIEMKWSDFVALEKSPDATNFDSIVTTLARAASKSNLRAIQTALDRLDGKVAMEIEVEYPKFYMRYPNATKTADDPGIIDAGETPKAALPAPAAPAAVSTVDEAELPTGSLRAVLDRMLDTPKERVAQILATAEAVDNGDVHHGDPLVKSVIIAGLMKMVHEGRISAVFETLDQIDGKVADKYKVLGDDVYLTSYQEVAPAGAYLNADGIYESAADNITNSWVTRLEEKSRKIR
jgi:hypothetical protein